MIRGNLALLPIDEAVDPNSPGRRAAAGFAAAREVLKDAASLERNVVGSLVRRLQQLKRELQGILASTGSEFRRFTASSLIADIDRILADAQADIRNGLRPAFNQAQDVGTAAAEQPVTAARIALVRAPSIDRGLASRAFDLTADLLTEPMQQFRNQLVQGVRRASVAGESSFDELRKLAGNIGAAGFDGAQFKAERMVRTELGRVLNSSTYDRMLALSKDFPFLRKGWRSAKDTRVRLGHVEAATTYARGGGSIPVRDKFRVNVHQERAGQSPKLIGVAELRYPLDPETTPAGRVAAGATIMCRCNAFIDFNLDELRAFATSRSRVTPEPKPEPSIEKPVAIPKPPRPARPERTAADARKRLAKSAETFAARQTRVQQQISAQQAAWSTDRAIRDSPSSSPAAVNAAVARIDQHVLDVRRLETELAALREAERKAHRRLLAVPADRRRKIEYDVPRNEQHGTGYFIDHRTATQKMLNKPEMLKRIKTTLKELESLVGVGVFGDVKVLRAKDAQGRLVSRAFARQNDNSININLDERQRTIVHEMGHILEFNNSNVKAAAFQFLGDRVGGEAAKKLSDLRPGFNYEPHEVARPDKFIDPYMGKDYGLAYTEIISMGLEYMYAEPVKFAREDPDYFDFMYDLLRGKFR